MKAIELPINTLVLIVIAIIVLLGIIAISSSVNSQGGSVALLQTAKDSACIKLRIASCDSDTSRISVKDIDVGGDGAANSEDDNLLALCSKFGANTESACKELCGCR